MFEDPIEAELEETLVRMREVLSTRGRGRKCQRVQIFETREEIVSLAEEPLASIVESTLYLPVRESIGLVYRGRGLSGREGKPGRREEKRESQEFIDGKVFCGGRKSKKCWGILRG